MRGLAAVSLTLIFYKIATVDSATTGKYDDRNYPNEKPLRILNKLRKDLFKSYDALSRPVLHNSMNTSVEVGINPVLLTDLDEKRGIMVMEAWIMMSWDDAYLKWNPEDYEGITVLHVPPNDIWKPDVTVYEGRGSEIDPFHNVLALVYNSGNIKWVPSATVQSICQLEYANYPDDTQYCAITLGPWTHSGLKIDLVPSAKTNLLENLRNINPTWSIDKMEHEKHVKFYDCCPEPYISVSFNFTLSRKVSLGGLSTTIPRSMASILVLLMFWTSRELTQKLILGCSSAVIITIVVVFVSFASPCVTAVPYALSRPSAALVLTVIAVMVEFLISIISNCGLSQPKWLKSVFESKASKYILCGVADFKSDATNRDDISLKTENELLATACERVAFILFFILFVATRALW